jgi:hypothetical protein
MRITTAARVMVGTSLAMAFIGGCSDETTVEAGSVGSPTAAARGEQRPRYEVEATVLESPAHGPQLCLGVLDSLPPQCDGPDVAGWDWAAVDGEESANGTTWGDFHLVGVWDGTTFTLAEPATAPQPVEPARIDLGSPCPEPAGGWAPVDPVRTTFETEQAAHQLAASLPGYAGSWVDQSPNPAFDENGNFVGPEEAANNPLLEVLNVRTTGSVADTEAAIRGVWGGALCVSPAERTMAELERIIGELDDPEFLSGGVDVVGNRVTATFMVADASTQARYDEQYGAGAVVVSGWLQPAG